MENAHLFKQPTNQLPTNVLVSQYPNVSSPNSQTGTSLELSGNAMGQMKREASAIDPLAVISNIPEPIFEESQIPSTIPLALPKPPVVDVVEVMTNVFISQCRTVPLHLSSVPTSISGLQTLARNCAWKEVLELSSKLHSDEQSIVSHQQFSPSKILRFEALFRLKMFDELQLESQYVLTNESTANEFLSTIDGIRLDTFNNSFQSISSNVHCSFPSAVNCDVFFSMRLLQCDLRVLTGAVDEGFSRLFELKRYLILNCETPVPPFPNAEFWLWRCRCVIVNSAIKKQKWRIAVEELSEMELSLRLALSTLPPSPLESDPSTTSSSTSSSTPFLLLSRSRFIVLCRLSQLLLQMGAVEPSQVYFQSAHSLLAQLVGPSSFEEDKRDSASLGFVEEIVLAGEYSFNYQHLTLLRGLLLFGRDEFSEAFDVFGRMISAEQTRAQRISPSPIMFPPSPSPSSSSQSEDPSHGLASSVSRAVLLSHDPDSLSLLGAATNNYTICAIFLKRISQALQQLELLVQEDPVSFLVDPVVFNLCMLYELSCAPELANNKKKMLHKVATSYHIQDPYLNARAFRLDK